MRLALIIFLFPLTLSAQSVSVAPLSMSLWGTTPMMGSVSVGYAGFEAHYFAPIESRTWQRGDITSQTRSAFAISYAHPIHKLVSAGVILFHRPFPVEEATMFNFILNVGYDFGPIGIYYRHISNGFGILHDVNPGVDHVVFRVNL